MKDSAHYKVENISNISSKDDKQQHRKGNKIKLTPYDQMQFFYNYAYMKRIEKQRPIEEEKGVHE